MKGSEEMGAEEMGPWCKEDTNLCFNSLTALPQFPVFFLQFVDFL